MKDGPSFDFGLAIAYVMPGFVTMWGLCYFSPTILSWFRLSSDSATDLGGFFYVLLASTGVGLIISAVRWAVIDRIYSWTGLPSPQWDYAALNSRLPAFKALIQHHYHYYQFYANMLVAVIVAYSARLVALHTLPGQNGWMDIGTLSIVVLLIAGSRDTLRKYYQRGTGFLKATRTRR